MPSLGSVCQHTHWQLKSEGGTGGGQGRLPLKERTCVCCQIQTEVHVTQHCTLTQQLRNTYDFSAIEELFSDKYSDIIKYEIVYKILTVYQ